MKKYSPIYTDSCVIYWPSFVGGIGLFCFCGITLLLYLSFAILILCDQNVANKTVFGMAIVAILLSLWLALTLKMIVKSMFCCIKITKEGFCIDNKATATHMNILWEQVSGIEFHQEGYRGRKQYRVYQKTDPPTQYIAIPISMVNEEKLQALMPLELLINKPYSI